MNIFFSHDDPRISARNLDDKRVNKMVLESAQMLCTAINEHGGLTKTQVGLNKRGKPKYEYQFASGNKAYAPTHANHPSNVWCRETRMNYGWLLMHFAALANEYTYRTGKVHKSYRELFNDLLHGINFIPLGNLTPYANCAARQDMNINYKHMTDVCQAYQLYLIDRWANDVLTPKWTNRSRPF